MKRSLDRRHHLPSQLLPYRLQCLVYLLVELFLHRLQCLIHLLFELFLKLLPDRLQCLAYLLFEFLLNRLQHLIHLLLNGPQNVLLHPLQNWPDGVCNLILKGLI